MSWPVAFACTVAIELVVVGLLGARLRWWGARGQQGWLLVLAGCVLVNLCTHPLLWWWTSGAGWPRLVAAELGAVLVEAVLWRQIVRGRLLDSLGVALCANATSFGLGLLLASLG